MNEKENFGKKTIAKDEPSIASTIEKAQFEVFSNGTLPRQTLEKWIKNDLDAMASFIHACRSDKKVLDGLVDLFYDRYVKLHANDDVSD